MRGLSAFLRHELACHSSWPFVAGAGSLLSTLMLQ